MLESNFLKYAKEYMLTDKLVSPISLNFGLYNLINIIKS